MIRTRSMAPFVPLVGLALLLGTTAPPVAAQTPGIHVSGKKLQVKQSKSGSQRLKMLVKDAAIQATTPCDVDGELVMMGVGVGLAAYTIPLDADLWQPIKANAPEEGCRYRNGPVLAKAVVKPGKSLKIVASATDLVPLVADPRPVRIEFRHGDLRHCVEFGGEGTHKTDKKLVAKNAGVASRCLGDVVGHEVFDRTGGLANQVVWLTLDLTPDEFDAIELPPGWGRNQSRGGDGVGFDGRFLRSPGRDADGEFTWQEMFGARWLHVTNIVGVSPNFDGNGILQAAFVEKFHQLTWRPGSTITVLTSPDGKRYALVSRDVDRTSDTPTIPDDWTLQVIPIAEERQVLLPTPTTVIRTDNQDSFQGPLPADLEL